MVAMEDAKVRNSVLLVAMIGIVATGDDLVYQYEGNSLPNDPCAGWRVFDACTEQCQPSVAGGHFILRWHEGTDFVNYTYIIAQSPDLPPEAPFWVEWRFSSDHPFNGISTGCDGTFFVKYSEVSDLVDMFGDAAVSFSGDDVRYFPTLADFRTYRFETPDGIEYEISIDGLVFTSGVGFFASGNHYLQFYGHGGCDLDLLPTVNRWDYIRYGTIADGEEIVSSDPPAGFVDARSHPALDRFTVTYDQPNYVYVDEITAAVAAATNAETQKRRNAETTPLSSPLHKGGVEGGPFDIRGSQLDIGTVPALALGALNVPAVIATRRLDNGPPETVEIVLDRPIPYNATTRFTFNDGAIEQSIEFTYAPGDIDGDGDADLYDFSALQNCFGLPDLPPWCQALDADANGSIDLSDFAAFHSQFLVS